MPPVAVVPPPGATVARVLPEVAGIDKEFDYLVPEAVRALVLPGAEVRVDLHGRRVGGWVTSVGPPGNPSMKLLPIAKLRGVGPEPELVDLAGWAALRWASRRSSYLSTASPIRAVTSLPPPRVQAPALPAEAWQRALVAPAPGKRPVVVRLPPAADPTPLVAAAAQAGPTLVVVPTHERAEVLATRLRRAGASAALLPSDWAQARAGAGIVVGTRSAAWGPCPGLVAAVVLDAEDESLGQEQAPTWHAVTVLAERARRVGATLVVLSSCPGPELLALGELRLPPRQVERRGWASIEVVDRRSDDPRLGLWSEQAVRVVRSARRVACVLNRTGRARLLSCGACGEVARCERCGSALVQAAKISGLICPRCALSRPSVCSACTSIDLRVLRVGVSRAREELEALAGRAVGEVTSATRGLPGCDVLVGTEALLRRVSPANRFEAVIFVDFDQELLAPRVRAAGEALFLLSVASRLVGGRQGRILVQTRIPDHPVIRSALLANPSVLALVETPLRRALRLPPFAAVALVSGEAAPSFVEQLPAEIEVLGPSQGRWMLKASDHLILSTALASTPRPPGSLRVAVDPARL